MSLVSLILHQFPYLRNYSVLIKDAVSMHSANRECTHALFCVDLHRYVRALLYSVIQRISISDIRVQALELWMLTLTI